MKLNKHLNNLSAILIIFTLIILFCAPYMLVNVKAQSNSGPYSILFDEAHEQYYTYSNETFKTALDYLNQTYDFIVHLNTAQFDNLSILSSYDLIIIGNPGPDGNFSLNEIEVLKNYTKLGGNLFLLCNYNDVENPSPDEDIIGYASNLNNITQALNLSALFNYYDLHSELHHNPIAVRWVVEIEDSKFKSFHPIKRKIQNVLTFTSGLNITRNQGIIATGYSDSYLKNREGQIINETPWLFASQQGISKIILCGSTVMFSDLNVTNELEKEYTGIPWIEAIDNLRLWANLIQWALITKNPNFFNIFITIACIITVVGVSLYIYHSYFVSPKISSYELKKQNLQDERAKILKEARSHASEGHLHAAAKLYKRAANLSKQLGDYQSENLYIKKYRNFLAKSKK